MSSMQIPIETVTDVGLAIHPKQHPITAKEALAELIDLLEAYGPTWYTEEIHNRAVSALRA